MNNGEPAAPRTLPSWIEWIMYLKSIDCSHRPSIPGVAAVSVCRSLTSVDAGLWQATQTCVLLLRLVPCSDSRLWQGSQFGITQNNAPHTGGEVATL